MKKSEKVDIMQTVIQDFVDELKPVVECIEEGSTGTKQNYQAYMGLFGGWKSKFIDEHSKDGVTQETCDQAVKLQMQLMAIALVKAGGSQFGVFHALEQVSPGWAD